MMIVLVTDLARQLCSCTWFCELLLGVPTKHYFGAFLPPSYASLHLGSGSFLLCSWNKASCTPLWALMGLHPHSEYTAIKMLESSLLRSHTKYIFGVDLNHNVWPPLASIGFLKSTKFLCRSWWRNLYLCVKSGPVPLSLIIFPVVVLHYNAIIYQSLQ